MEFPRSGKKRMLTIGVFVMVVVFAGSLTLHGQNLGDVNSNGSIDIVDALLIAQYYVGLNPSSFGVSLADVNASSGIDIVDALLIAQYYVGLITGFPGSGATPTPVQSATSAPNPTGTAVPPASGPYSGYTLYGGMSGKTIYLVDMNGNAVHTWACANGCGYSQYLLEDGTILCSGTYRNSTISGGGDTGMIQKIDWNGNVTWSFRYSDSANQLHHDIEPMPNGNVLCISWELKSAAEATAAGRSQSMAVWPDKIMEVQPQGTSGGTIVWEWHAWDHLIQDYSSSKANYGVVADHPELLDVNCGSGSGMSGSDWMHVNGVSYNPERDEITFSSHYLNEIYVIDHSTTTQEAAGHSGGKRGKGGDFLYRWGNPLNYDRGSSRVFYTVHDAHWIKTGLPGAGNLCAFNNGSGRPDGNYSSIDEIVPPYDANGNYVISAGAAYGPSTVTWTYKASGFFSSGQSGSQRLPNGNTLVCETGGTIFEVTSAGTMVWEHTPKSGSVARALRYAPDYPGLASLPN